MSLIRDVLLAAHDAGVPDADIALRDLAQLTEPRVVKLIAASGDTIHATILPAGEPMRWEAPAPFFAVPLAALIIEPHQPQALRLIEQ